jgi:hypothetical protein
MTDEVRMPLEAVRAHANTLDTVSADLTTAHGAANQVYLDTEAFGILCQFLPGMFDPVLRATVDGIGKSSSTLTTLGGKLRTAASNSETADTQNAASITSSGNHPVNLPL